MTRAEYAAECKRLFNADRYGWSLWEEDATDRSYDDDRTPEQAVASMNQQYAMRRANRSA